ncbi:MAG: hypothetical protein AB1758_04430, partial [Candidatus Eremiobacterota bacterium]
TPAYTPGTQVSFTYDPELLEISARGGDAPRTFTLVPEMDGEYASREAYRLGVQARECQTLFSYFVEGQAISYDTQPTLRATTRRSGEFSNGGLVPARIRQLYADNARFEPGRIQVGQPTTFKADVVSCLFEDPQIFWTLTVEGERLVDPEDPEGDVETFPAFTAGTEDWQDFGPDFALQAGWNGLLPDGSPAPAGLYSAGLEVKVRERTRVDRDGNPIELISGGSAQVQLFGERLEIHDFLATPPSVDPATVEDLRFAATAVPIDFVDSPDIAWHFRFLNPEGTEVVATDIGFGPGRAFDFFLDTQALSTGIYTAELRAEAVSPSAPTPVWSEVATVRVTVGNPERKVIIDRFAADPELFSPELGETTTFGIEARVVGFDDPTPATECLLEFFVDGAKAHEIRGIGEAGTPLEVSWDGKDEQGVILPEGEYEVQLTVTACDEMAHVPDPTPTPTPPPSPEPPPVQCKSSDAKTRVRLGGVRIEVVGAGSQDLLATSFQQYPGIGNLLDRVLFPVTEEVIVKVVGLPATPIERVKVRIQSSKTLTSVVVDIEKLGGKFERRLNLAGLFPRAVDPVHFSTFDGNLPLGDSESFRFTATNSGGIHLGRAVPENQSEPAKILPDYTDDDLDEVTINARTLTGGGYELLSFQLDEPDLTTRKVEALLRVQHLPGIIYLGEHGTYYSVAGEVNLELITGRQYDDPTVKDLPPDALRGVEGMILAVCCQLNLNDYLNHKTRFARIPVNSPARVWDAATAGQAVLLGYNSTAPTLGSPLPGVVKAVDQVILESYLNELGIRLSSGGRITAVSQDDTSPLAWMQANVDIDRLDYASAIDSGFYYYLDFNEEVVQLDRKTWKYTHRKRRVVKVPRSDWNKPLKRDHRKLRVVMRGQQGLDEFLPDQSYTTDAGP